MQNYGLAHVWAQGDFVTRGIALALLIMSVLSWSVIVIKAWNVMRLKRLTKNAEQLFWHSDDLSDGVKKTRRRYLGPAGQPVSRARPVGSGSRRSSSSDATASARSHGRVGLDHALPERHHGRQHRAHAERSRGPRVDRQHGAVRRPVRHGMGRSIMRCWQSA